MSRHDTLAIHHINPLPYEFFWVPHITFWVLLWICSYLYCLLRIVTHLQTYNSLYTWLINPLGTAIELLFTAGINQPTRSALLTQPLLCPHVPCFKPGVGGKARVLLWLYTNTLIEKFWLVPNFWVSLLPIPPRKEPIRSLRPVKRWGGSDLFSRGICLFSK